MGYKNSCLELRTDLQAVQRRVAFGSLQASQRLSVSSSKARPLSVVVKTDKADGF
jgi:hypothetical protein